MGRGGALSYMPEDFEREILWASNGKFTGMDDVINAFNKGSGFVFFSGHGSPNSWGDQYPGIPGDRGPASVTGLLVTTLRIFRPTEFLKILSKISQLIHYRMGINYLLWLLGDVIIVNLMFR